MSLASWAHTKVAGSSPAAPVRSTRRKACIRAEPPQPGSIAPSVMRRHMESSRPLIASCERLPLTSKGNDAIGVAVDDQRRNVDRAEVVARKAVRANAARDPRRGAARAESGGVRQGRSAADHQNRSSRSRGCLRSVVSDGRHLESMTFPAPSSMCADARSGAPPRAAQVPQHVGLELLHDAADDADEEDPRIGGSVVHVYRPACPVGSRI